jgi:hypothetical protein
MQAVASARSRPHRPASRALSPSRRTAGLLDQPQTVCGIWANDFALTGIMPPCTPTPILTLSSQPPGVTGVTVK